jgi:phage shock protein PspC (stress-responsive transcriptional regulator)
MLMNRRLYRSVSDRKIGGVAAGTATYFDIDPSISRVLWLLLAIFTGGAFLIVYLVMWAVVPEEPWTPPVGGGGPAAASPTPAGEGDDPGAASAPAEGETPVDPAMGSGQPPGPPTSTWSASTEVRSGPGPHVIFGTILILIGGWFLLDQFIPWLNFGTIWPIGLVAIGAIILVAALRRSG